MEDKFADIESEQKPFEKSESKNKNIVYIVLIVLAALIAAAGMWFYRQGEIDKIKQAQSGSASNKSQSSEENLVDLNQTINWPKVLLGPALLEDGSGEAGKTAGLSFGLPIAWTVKQCAGGGGLTAYVSPSDEAQASCNSEGSAPVVISVQSGDFSDGYDYSDTSIYRDQKTETVKVDGRDFTKASATIASPIEFQPPEGSKLVSYYAVIDGVTYSATYVYISGDSDDLTAEFVKIVEKTLTITTP